MGIEEDHLAPGRGTKARPSAPSSQLHCPDSTAGSTHSMSERCRRRPFDGRRDTSSNRTPRRSITTFSPRSAASRRSENRWRAAAADRRKIDDEGGFICTMYDRDACHTTGHRITTTAAMSATGSVRRARGATGRFGLSSASRMSSNDVAPREVARRYLRARPGRFELPTPGSVDQCSIQLSYGRVFP